MPQSRDPEWEAMVQEAVKSACESLLEAWKAHQGDVPACEGGAPVLPLHQQVTAVECRSGWQDTREALVPCEYRLVISPREPDIRVYASVSEDGRVLDAYIVYQWGVSGGRHAERNLSIRDLAQHFIDAPGG